MLSFKEFLIEANDIKPIPKSNKELYQKVLVTLRKFILREFPNLFDEKTANKEAEVVMSSTKDNYIMGRARFGLNVQLDRSKKNSIWRSYENALNHASFNESNELEDLKESKFKDQIQELKAKFGKMERISFDDARKMNELLRTFDTNLLKELVKANINFVSMTADTILRYRK